MKQTVCDFCSKPISSGYGIHLPNIGRVVIKTIVDGKWKSKDVCINCLKKMIDKEFPNKEQIEIPVDKTQAMLILQSGTAARQYDINKYIKHVFVNKSDTINHDAEWIINDFNDFLLK